MTVTPGAGGDRPVRSSTEPLGRLLAVSVSRELTAALADRELVLSAAELAAARAQAARDGERLWRALAEGRPPVEVIGGPRLSFAVLRRENADRLDAALAFGATVGRLLVPHHAGEPMPAPAVEQLCALFNLAAGIIDGLCDTHPGVGTALVELAGPRLAEAVVARGRPDWLRAALPPPLRGDVLVAFDVAVLELLADAVHAAYPSDADIRRRIGEQFRRALEAELGSVRWAGSDASVSRLTGLSRQTSVLSIEIIHTLAGAEGDPQAGTLLGEASWLIDDLIDLGPDAATGAVNSLLIAAADRGGLPLAPGRWPQALERLIYSEEIAAAADRAADRLERGLRRACAGGDLRSCEHARSLLHFLQLYAAIAPREPQP